MMFGRKSKLEKITDFATDHPVAIIGSALAVGYAVSRVVRSNRSPSAEDFHITDADRALEFQPRPHYEQHDAVGDPSVRSSVGLEGSFD